MPAYFEPVSLPERCLLREVLYWLAFQRLPVNEVDHEGTDIRESREGGGYVIEAGPHFIYPDECVRARIPMDDPEYSSAFGDDTYLDVSHYDQYLERSDLDDNFRRHLEREREGAIAFEEKRRLWKPHYLRAVEYPTSRIFVALKSGQLQASGRLLPAGGLEALSEDEDIFDIEVTPIHADFWSLQGIDFESSAAKTGTVHYCHISLPTNEVISIFPGDREPVDVQRG